MITVRSKQELEVALKNKTASVRIEGPYAKTFANAVRSRRRKAKVAIGFGALAVIGGLAAAPFTGGASLAGTVMGATAMGLTVGTVTICTAELAMILGFAAYALNKKYTIKIGDGDKYVEMRPQ
ncbi:MAG: hypothetical protein MR470_08170 [Prevotella sp.]|nr:hypothetical protein [Prevotella sp.]